ncbi:MAG: tRNA dihydrouridine synthase DusB [Candidatus Enteromonas sp.]|nr:tRNA dihydrouridine synthase DusB [Candidatus Enteromonas sp.]
MFNKDLSIGNIVLPSRVVLGPMAGITTLAYREFMKPFGVGLSFSEMISDCGIDYENRRTYEYLATSDIDRPVGLQIFGFSEENSVKAVQIIQKQADYDFLDINLGCPVTKVVKTGAGSAWLKNPEALEEYVRAIVEVSEKPVTAKIRLGWDEDSINVEEVSHRLENAGVSLLSIHCRTRSQGYSGKANYEAIAGLKETLKIPLCVSGDIFSLKDAKRALEVTHADAIMVARGAVGNPYLVTQIKHYMETGEELPNPDVVQQAKWALEYSQKLIDLKGEFVAVRELRGIIPHFFSGAPGYKKVRNEIAMNTYSKEQLFRVLNGIILRGNC